MQSRFLSFHRILSGWTLVHLEPWESGSDSQSPQPLLRGARAIKAGASSAWRETVPLDSPAWRLKPCAGEFASASPQTVCYLFAFLLEGVCFCRYNLPVVIIVVNNNGIYSGVDPETWKEMAKMGDLTSM